MTIMKTLNLGFLIILIFSAAVVHRGQATTVLSDKHFVKSSPAFAEVLLKKTELEAELEDLLVAYTLEFPPVKKLQFEIGLLNTALEQLFKVKIEESSKLTLALGRLMVRRAELETERWQLKQQYNDDHPSVKKVDRKILVFESAIKDVLL